MKITLLERIQKIFAYVRTHKVISIFVFAAVLYFGYTEYKSLTSTAGETRYVTAFVEKGTIISSITGSGQVSAFNQLDLKPKASGDIIYVGVVNGQEVSSGALIAQLDSSDADKAVRDAEANLESAKLSLQKLTQPADTLSLIQAENAVSKAQESKQNAEDSLKKAYEDGFNNTANTFLALPTVIAGLQDMLYSGSRELGGAGVWNADYYAGVAGQYSDKATVFKQDVYDKYQAARVAYDKSFNDYKASSRYSDTKAIEALIVETYDATKTIAEAVKSANNLIQLYKDELTKRNLTVATLANTHLATLNTYTGTTNTNLLTLLNATDSIKTDKDAIVNGGRAITEATESLSKLKAGAGEFDVASSELLVKQRKNALLDAQENLAHYFVRAPFAGTIAKLNVKKGDPVGVATSVATLITKQKIAEISLNEVDAAKVKVGQKATLTFDAVENLSIAGEVAEIDTVGTVSQGVVTYMVKISFGTQDDRVKSGMSVSAAIIINMKQDVLLVPNSAVKNQGGIFSVEIFDTPLVPLATSTSGSNTGVPSMIVPRQQRVEAGLSNDTMTEIVSGLKDGEQVVSRTIAGTANTATQAPSIFSAAGIRAPGTGGGARNTTGR